MTSETNIINLNGITVTEKQNSKMNEKPQMSYGPSRGNRRDSQQKAIDQFKPYVSSKEQPNLKKTVESAKSRSRSRSQSPNNNNSINNNSNINSINKIHIQPPKPPQPPIIPNSNNINSNLNLNQNLLWYKWFE
jgi:hypothetical protein